MLFGLALLLAPLAITQAEELTWVPGGAGNTWSQNGGSWAGGKNWTNNDSAIFGGTAQPITLTSNGLVAQTLTFNSDYRFTSQDSNWQFEFSKLVVNDPSRVVTFDAMTANLTGTSDAFTSGTIVLENAAKLVIMGVEAVTTNAVINVHDTSVLAVDANLAISGGTLNFYDSSKLQLQKAGIVGGLQYFTGDESMLIIDANSTGSISGGSQYFTGAHAHLEAGRANSIVSGGTQSFSGNDATLGLHVTNAVTGGEIYMRGQNAHLYVNATGALAGGVVNMYRQATLTLSAENGTTKAAELIFNKGSEQHDDGGYLDMNGHSTTIGAISSADWGAGIIHNDTGSAVTLTTDFSTASKTFSGTIRDAASTPLTVHKAGTGTLNLYGSNSYHGETIVSGGVLGIRDIANLGYSPTVRLDGGEVRLTEQYILFSQSLAVNNTGGTLDIGIYGATFHALSGTGALTVKGTGGLAFLSNSTYSGNIAIEAGELYIEDGITLTYGADGNTSPVLSGKVHLLDFPSGHGTLALNGNSTITANIIGEGDALIRKEGSGTAVIRGANGSFSGYTTLNGGTLGIANDTALGTSLLTINGGGIRAVDAAHTLGNNVVVNGSFDLGRELDFTGSVTLNNDITITSTNPDAAAHTTSSFSGNINSNNHHLTFAEGQNGNGTIALAGQNSFTSGVTFAGGIVRLDSQNALGSGSSTLSFTGGTLQYSSGNQGDYSSRFNGGGNQQIRIDTNGQNVQYNTSIHGANTTLTKLGEGTITFATSSDYNGGTILNGGTLGVNNDQALGSGTITVHNGAIRAVGQGRTLSNALVLDGSLGVGRATTFNGNVSLASNSTISTNNPDGLANVEAVFNGVISGDHSLTIVDGLGGQTTNGAILLTGNNTYTGGTFINGGLLAITNSNALGQAGTDVTFAGGNGALQLQNTMNLQRRFVIGAGGGTFDNNGHDAYFNELAGISTFAKVGSGRLTLTRNSVFEGLLNVAEGTFQIDTGATLRLGDGGTGGTLNGDLIDNGALIFKNSGNISYSNNITGTGNLSQDGTGTLTLSGTNTYGGGTFLNAGVVFLNSANALAEHTIVFNGGTLRFGAANSKDYSSYFSTGDNQRISIDTATQQMQLASNLTSAGGSLTKYGSGTLQLLGTNTYNGGTTIEEGTLEIGNGGAEGSIVGSVTNKASLVINRSGTIHLGHVTGSGVLYNRGSGTLWLDGTEDNVALSATAEAGTIMLAKDSNANVHAIGYSLTIDNGATARLAGSGGDQIYEGAHVVVNTGGTFDLNNRNEGFDALTGGGRVTNTGSSSSLLTVGQNNSSFEFTGEIVNGSGTVNVRKEGSGTFTLSGTNTYSGITVIVGGRLLASSNHAVGTGRVEIMSGGEFYLASQVKVNNLVLLGSGKYTKSFNSENLAHSMDSLSFLSGGNDTRASFLAGSASATIETSFSLGNELTRSDIYHLSGTGSSIFVLELSFSSSKPGSLLGWLNESNQWVNARDGNTGTNNPLFTGQFNGSYAEFLEAHPTLSLADSLGAWGLDQNGQAVWAVLNHNSAFAAVPEPSTWALLGLGFTALVVFRRRMTNGRR